MKIFRRRMKLPENWFRRRWLFALVGSALILASTFATGYIVDRQERRAKDAEGQAREAAQALEESEHKQQVALDSLEQVLQQKFVLASILAGGSSQASRTLFESLKRISENNEATLQRSVITLLEEAAGPDVDEKVVAEYRRLTELEAKGQKVDSQQQTATKNLEAEVDDYQEQLRTQQDKFEKEKDSAEQNSTSARLLALTLQVVGLVLLLIKEVPLESKKGAPAPPLGRAKEAAASG